MTVSRNKRIVMLTSQHSVFDGRVFHLEAKSLVEAGYDVTIVTPERGGEPSEKDGVKFVTFKKAESGIKRKWSTLKYLSYYAMKLPADYLHVHEVDAPLMAATWAKKKLAKRGKSVKVIFDSHEVWPFFYALKTRIRFLRFLIRHCVMAYESWMLKHGGVDAVIANHAIEESYYLFLHPWLPVRQVLSGPPLEDWGPPPERSGEINLIGHDGFFSLQRGMSTMLGAFELIARDYPNLKFVAAGDFQVDDDRNYFNSWVKRTGLGDRVEFAGWVGREDILGYLDRMDIGLVANRPDTHSIRCWPANKMMYYLGRGLPVVSTPNPLYYRFISKVGCGSTARNFSAKAMAESLRKLLDNPEETRLMGKRGYEVAMRDFRWESAREELLGLYNDLEEGNLLPHDLHNEEYR